MFLTSIKKIDKNIYKNFNNKLLKKFFIFLYKKTKNINKLKYKTIFNPFIKFCLIIHLMFIMLILKTFKSGFPFCTLIILISLLISFLHIFIFKLWRCKMILKNKIIC